MSVPFEERLIQSNQNAGLIMQPEEDMFLRKAPLIEEESSERASGGAPTSLTAEPAWARSRALAQKIISKQDLRPKADTGWKLFSPSTWGIFRNTAWGRKKAQQRQITSMTSKMNQLGKATKMLDPRSGFFSNASWDDEGSGPRGMTGVDATPDANLTGSKAYGMSKVTADLWAPWTDAHAALESAQEMYGERSPEYREAFVGLFNAQRQLDKRQSWQELNAQPGEQADDSEDHQKGDIVDGHAWLGSTNDDEGGIPSIVQEVLGPRGGIAGAANAPVETAAPMQGSAQDFDEDDDGSLFDEDEDAGGQNQFDGQDLYGGKGPSKAEMGAAMKRLYKNL